uniref:AraC family transcriptional regulator n=1 Tax=Enterococcus faecalis TaxID=1351 RepID=UPI0021B0B67A
HLYHSRMGFFFHHLRGETKKVIIRLPLGSFRRFQLKSMNYSGLLLGFSDTSHFTKVFKKITGTTPKKYQMSVDSKFTLNLD